MSIDQCIPIFLVDQIQFKMQFDTGQILAYVYMTTKGSLALNNFTFLNFFA